MSIRTLTRNEYRDSGLALCLVALLLHLWLGLRALEWIAIAVLVFAMTAPAVFKYFAVAWFALSAAIGAVTSRVLYAVLFGVLVTPVGLVRRWIGHDAMRMKEWRRGPGSVFVVRNHRFTAKDFERPY